MPIKVVLLSGKTVTLDVDQTALVEDANESISRKAQVPPELQRLAFAGHLLEPGKRLEEYHVQSESTIHLCLPCLCKPVPGTRMSVGTIMRPSGCELGEDMLQEWLVAKAEAIRGVTLSGETVEALTGGGAPAISPDSPAEPVGAGVVRLPDLVNSRVAELLCGDVASFVSAHGFAAGHNCHQLELKHSDWDWIGTVFEAILPKLLPHFPQFEGLALRGCPRLQVSCYIITEDEHPEAPAERSRRDEFVDLFDLTVDICLCTGSGGGVWGVEGDVMRLPPVPLGGYAWTRDFRHSAAPLASGERVHLLLFANVVDMLDMS